MEIGARIDEILQERNIDLKPFAEMIGMSRDTLRNTVKGKKNKNGAIERRVPLSFELQKIADGLGVTVDRLTGKDVKKEEDEIIRLLSSGYLPQKAHVLASEIFHRALGSTERMRFNWYMGETLVNLAKNEEAKKYFVDAYEYAKMTKNVDLARKSANKIILFYYYSKDYDEMSAKTKHFEEFFKEDYNFRGKLEMYRGLCAYFKNDIDNAITHYNLSLDHFRNAQDSIQEGRVLLNLADIEYCKGDYSRSRDMLLSAKERLDCDTLFIKLMVDKDLARTHKKLGEISEALNLIAHQLDVIERNNLVYPDLHSKLLLLRADILKNNQDAEKIFAMQNVDKNILASAAKYLANYYYKEEDYQKSSNYFMKLQSLSPDSPKNIDEL